MRRKIFCIGSGKTGTTSMEAALRMLGFRLGDQGRGELLLEAWACRDFHPIIKFCKGAEAFQDIPFCLDYTYVALDHAFPGAKFILTVRDDPDAWYNSLIRFHTRLLGKGRTPTADDLKGFGYRAPGWLWRVQHLLFGVDESTLYDPEIYKGRYEHHRLSVIEYFRHRPDDLLVFNLRQSDAMDRLCRFLEVKRSGLQMPHLNATQQAA